MDKSAAYTSDTSNENTSEMNVAPVGLLARQRRTIQGVTSRKAREREASLSAPPLLLQAVPSVLVDPTIDQGLSPAAIAQLSAAESFKNDVVEQTNKVRLEMLALQSLTYKKKVLAEAKVQQDRG